MPNKSTLPTDIVEHPRYGKRVRPGRRDVSESVVRSSYRGYRNAMIYPESTINATVSEQNLGPMESRSFYVDILETCRDCQRPFLFFAVEQKYWYETLKFHIDAECTRCAECRKEIQHDRKVFAAFSRLVVQTTFTDEQLSILAENAIVLWRQGRIKNLHTLNRIKNLVLRQIPNSEVASEILELTKLKNIESAE
ncbi:zinc-ribbon domain-containing protein [Mariniblastus sp.]|nr:zinc-ribbon domain-containing protein [Mariniblastus sp.]